MVQIHCHRRTESCDITPNLNKVISDQSGMEGSGSNRSSRLDVNMSPVMQKSGGYYRGIECELHSFKYKLISN